MSIKDEQIYEASKEILKVLLNNLDAINSGSTDGFSKCAVRCAKIMADEIDRDNLKPEFKRADNEGR